MPLLNAPKTGPIKEIEIKNCKTKIQLFHPQIASGMAMIPIFSNEVEGNIPNFIDDSMIDRDVFFLDDTGGYDRLRIQNNSNDSILVPPATHLVGGKQNRGVNKLELLRQMEDRIVDAHCYEPSRGSGSNKFTETSETPIDIAFSTMTTRGYDRAWDVINTYSKLVGRRRDALYSFLKDTDKDRTKLALNFEPLKNQTGVLSTFGSEYMSLEIYPNSTIFNQFRDKIYKGKFASLLWKKIQEGEVPIITPRDVSANMDKFFSTFNDIISSSELIPMRPIDDEYSAVTIREGKFIADFVINRSNELVYIFAMQKFK